MHLGLAMFGCSSPGGPAATHGGALPAAFVAAREPRPVASGAALAGRVTDEMGDPVRGATVFAGSGVPSTTDGDGRFELTGVVGTCPCPHGVEIRTSHPQFEFSVQTVPVGTRRFAIQLRRPLRLTAGESRMVAVGPQDTLHGFELENRARPMRIVAPDDGVLRIQVSTETPEVRAAVSFDQFPLGVPSSHAERPVASGADYVAYVITDASDGPALIRVVTGLAP